MRKHKDLVADIAADMSQTHEYMVGDINFEIVMLYWRIGKKIVEFGAEPEVIRSLHRELKGLLPYANLTFDSENIAVLIQFALDYPDEGFVEEVFTQLNWEIIIFLLKEFGDKTIRHDYACQAIQYQWSLSELRDVVVESKKIPAFHSSLVSMEQGLIG